MKNTKPMEVAVEVERTNVERQNAKAVMEFWKRKKSSRWVPKSFFKNSLN